MKSIKPKQKQDAPVSVRLPKELLEKIDNLAAKRNATRSQVILAILNTFIGR